MKCERCGEKIKPGKHVIRTTFDNEKRIKEMNIYCQECDKEIMEFSTPACIPGISNTQWELKMHRKKKREKSPRQILIEILEDMRGQGMTVPEISQELGLDNKSVMKLCKSRQ